MMKDQNKKKEEQRKALQTFIDRFSANASKSRQATSRKKLLEKISLDEIEPSNRRYPFISFQKNRDVGNEILRVDGLGKSSEGTKVFEGVSFTVDKGDKIAFIGDENAISALFEVLAGESEADESEARWGITITASYFPKDNTAFFPKEKSLNILDWLRQFSLEDTTDTYMRGFLGKMLFSGDEVYKSSAVLSGGEKVRCMLARMMLKEANVLLMDQPTNHLDLETITALNNGMSDFNSNILFTSHDHELISSVANRVIELQPDGMVDFRGTYDQYLDRKLGIQA